MMLIRSRMIQLFMFYGPSALLLTFLVLGVELELQFLNHISLFAKLLNSLAFCYINDHDCFMLFVFQCVLSRKKHHRHLLHFCDRRRYIYEYTYKLLKLMYETFCCI